MMWGYGGGMVGMMFWLGLFWIALLVGIGFLIHALVTRWQHGDPARPNERDDPLAIARIRYARGEITRQEYREMLHDLTGKGSDAP